MTPRALYPVGLALASLALVTILCSAWFGVGNATIPALLYLLIVLVAAAYSGLRVALVASVGSVLLLNYFFLPPRGTFVIAEPDNWVALFVLLVVSLMASQLSSSARSKAVEATARRDELARLFDLSRDILVAAGGEDAHARLAQSIGQRFDLPYVAIALPAPPGWRIHEAGRPDVAVSPEQLEAVFRDAGGAGDPARPDASREAHHTVHVVSGPDVQIVPLRVGSRPVGLLATAGRRVDAGTLDAVAGLAAIAVERVKLLDERRNAELARESAELKSTLLASLAHDLRTPLTAIRVAAGNLQAAWTTDAERQAQSEIVLAEVARLNRLFQNILDMARIQAEALSPERQWVTPDEIVEAAVGQAQAALERHPLSIEADGGACVHVDPRLTATALAHLVENAAQYSPPGTPVSIRATADADGLRLIVEDEGPGVSAEDLPRVFDRGFRGGAAAGRPAGLGMGLTISRGLVEAEGGTLSVENRPEGGARFWATVPSPVRAVQADP